MSYAAGNVGVHLQLGLAAGLVGLAVSQAAQCKTNSFPIVLGVTCMPRPQPHTHARMALPELN